jgi:dTDP-4-amino-4,6-dideoxygalactose transaminase
MGTAGCLSFFPSKNLGAYGDGGMLLTDDDDLARRIRMLRAHGSQPKYFHPMIGANSRLDALQAAILLAKLPHLEDWAAGRRARAAYYDRALDGIRQITRPTVRPENEPVYHQYVIRTRDRDGLMAFLKNRGVGTAIYYPLPLHLQECYRDLGGKEGDFPVSEAAARETLAIPMYPELTDGQQDYVVAAIRGYFGA